MNRWEISILRIIESNAGSSPLSHVYAEIPRHIDLTDRHREIRYKVPNYHHQTRAHIDDLMDCGDLVRISRGVYSVTSQGLQRLTDMRSG